MIRLKRAYDPVEESDGVRILVDRLWPRGIKKEKLQATFWMKDAAPSTELRKWFHRDPDQWEEFRARYLRELKRPEARKALHDIAEAAQKGNRRPRIWSEGRTAQSGGGAQGSHRIAVNTVTDNNHATVI